MIQQTDMQGTTDARWRGGDPRTLLANYVAICNQAIAENRDRFWLKQAKRLGEKLWNGANFRTIVYDRDPGDVIDAGVLHFDASTMELTLLPPGEDETALSWKVPLDYLEDVVHARPGWYVKNPLRLDWGWMKERVADEARYRVDGPSLAAGFIAGAAAGLLFAASRKRKSNRDLRYLKDEVDRLRSQE